jgi:hypothetical protein
MAIQVNGTTVIDDSRNLQNVGGLKTVGGNSILGSGNITTGASTAVNGVGTYTVAHDTSQSNTVGVGYKEGRTTAGSNLESRGIEGGALAVTNQTTSTSGTTGLTSAVNNSFASNTSLQSNQTYSGSWRLMTPAMRAPQEASPNWGPTFPGLWVRYA